MSRPVMRWILLAIGLVVAFAAQAQVYPSRSVRVVVGFAAGGSTDKLARLVALRLSEELGQSVVVENRPGAAGNIAAEAVAGAPPDGYTLFMATLSSQAINPHLYEKLNFDAIKSFEPIMLVAKYPLLLVVPPALVDAAYARMGNLLLTPPSLSQHAGLAAFDCRDELEGHVATYRANREAILESLDELQRRLSDLRTAVSDSDEEALLSVLERSSAARQALPSRSSTEGGLSTLRIPVADRPGILAEMTGLAGDLGISVADVEIAHSVEGARGVLLLVVPSHQADRLAEAVRATGTPCAVEAL